MYFFDPQMEAVYLLSFFHREVRVQVSCSLINQYNTIKRAEEQEWGRRLSLCNFSVLDHFGVHTALGSGQRCSRHGRREKGWQPQWTALVLTKEALWKEKAKISHFMPALLFYTPFCCIFCSTQRSADIRYAPASSYFHYRNSVAILLLFFIFACGTTCPLYRRS